MIFPRRPGQFCQWFDRPPAALKLLALFRRKMAQSAVFSGGARIRTLVNRLGLKQEPPRRVMGEDLFLSKLLFYMKLDVLGDEPVGGELADDPPCPPVEQPLRAHNESNGSHRMTPPG
jgi:hypothetical protein